MTSSGRFILSFVTLVLIVSCVCCAPISGSYGFLPSYGGFNGFQQYVNYPYQPIPFQQQFDPRIPGPGRDFIGDLIISTGLFPIEINVPDTIGAIGNGLQQIITNLGQRLPFVNRFTSPVTPRPINTNRFYLLVPFDYLQQPNDISPIASHNVTNNGDVEIIPAITVNTKGTSARNNFPFANNAASKFPTYP